MLHAWRIWKGHRQNHRGSGICKRLILVIIGASLLFLRDTSNGTYVSKVYSRVIKKRVIKNTPFSKSNTSVNSSAIIIRKLEF